MNYRLCYLRCSNSECRDLIWLHPSNPLPLPRFQIVPQVPALEPVEIFACPHCGYVSEYRRSAVRELDSVIPDPYGRDDLALRLLEFDCAQEHCGSRVTIQNPVAFHLRDDAERFLRNAKSWTLGEVHCGKGHQIRELPPEERCLTSLPSQRWAHTLPVSNLKLHQQLLGGDSSIISFDANPKGETLLNSKPSHDREEERKVHGP
jgi:hypothetical protein